MTKEMFELSLFTTKQGYIAIQSPGGCEELQTVLITPEQAEAVARWILEAKAELLGESRK